MTAAEFRSTLKATGITQKWLAARLGVTQQTVNRWAMGTIDVPQYAVAFLELYAERQEIARRLSA